MLNNPDAALNLTAGQRVVWYGDRGQVLGRGVVLHLAGDVYAVQLDGDADGASEIHRQRLVREEVYSTWYAGLSN